MTTGEPDAGKLACPVREGADGKDPNHGHLAGGLLHLQSMQAAIHRKDV